MDLTRLKCQTCREGEPRLTGAKLQKYASSIEPSWKLYDSDSKIKREFEFPNFKKAMEFVNKVADIAEAEGHHPNIYVYDYKKVRTELFTHKIGGLHQNDFILASKIDALP